MNAKISYVLKEIDGYLIDYLSFARDYTVTYARMYKRERIKIQIQNKYTIVAISVVFDDDIIAYKNFIQNVPPRAHSLYSPVPRPGINMHALKCPEILFFFFFYFFLI